MKDLYEILGVSRGASGDEIKKAYRKLAKDLHPDRHPGNKVIEDQFKEISAANSILSDPELRSRYDRGEIDSRGAEQRFRQAHQQSQGGSRRGFEGFGGFSAEDIINEIFGARGPGRNAVRSDGADHNYKLKVSFIDGAKGVKKHLRLRNAKRVSVQVPQGVSQGQQIRLKGLGGSGSSGGKPGDALVKIEIKPHEYFTRDGSDIHLDLPITLQEAVLGGKVEVPTVDGTVTMTVPKGSNSGNIMRLAGKGIAEGERSGRGDQFVALKVMLPKTQDNDLEKAVSKWSAGHSYDVRGHLRKSGTKK